MYDTSNEKLEYYNQHQEINNFFEYCEALKKPYSQAHSFLCRNKIKLTHYNEGVYFLQEFLPSLPKKEFDTVYNTLQRSYDSLAGSISTIEERISRFIIRLDKKKDKTNETRSSKEFIIKTSEDLLSLIEQQKEYYHALEKYVLVEKMMQYCDQHVAETATVTREELKTHQQEFTSKLNAVNEENKKRHRIYRFMCVLTPIALNFLFYYFWREYNHYFLVIADFIVNKLKLIFILLGSLLVWLIKKIIETGAEKITGTKFESFVSKRTNKS